MWVKPASFARRAAGQFAYGVLVADLSNARRAKDAGFTHMSGYVAWKRVEPAKGQFVFNTKNQYGQTTANDLTNVLAAARDNGLKLILRIDEPPDWAGGAVHRISPADLENYLFEALRYARGFAPGTVEYVEVFNELNLPFEWGTSPVDPAAYARQLAGAYRGIRRADPSVRVVSAAMSQRTGGLFGTMEDVDLSLIHI